MRRIFMSLIVVIMGLVFMGCSGGQLSSFEQEKETLTEGVGTTTEEKVAFDSPFVCISPIEEFGNIHINYRPNQTPELAFVNMLLNFPERIKQAVGIEGCKVERACVAVNAISRCEEYADRIIEGCKKESDAEGVMQSKISPFCKMTKEEIVGACNSESSSTSSSALDISYKTLANVGSGLSIKGFVVRLMTDKKCSLDENSKSKIPSDAISILDNDVIVAMSFDKVRVMKELPMSEVVKTKKEVEDSEEVESEDAEVVMMSLTPVEEKEITDKTKSNELLEKVKTKLERDDIVITKPACWSNFTGDLSVAASGSSTKVIVKNIDCQCLAGALAFDKEKATFTFSSLGEDDALLIGGTINFGYELMFEFIDTAFLEATN